MTIPIGISIRNMGVESTPDLIRHCAVEAEKAGLHSLWVMDHIAIPPDEAEGSGGRYLDPLATLAWLGGQTSKILLGTGVVVLPYRPKVALGKWVASVQELTAERLILGVGIGWMRAEFDAVGVPHEDRARISEETLDYLHRGFAQDVVCENGQDFIFSPRPKRPPILMGGAAPHATDRALRLADGWFAMSGNASALAPAVKAYKKKAAESEKEAKVYTYARADDGESSLSDRLRQLEDIGVDGVVAGFKYSDADSFSRGLDQLMKQIG